MSGISSKLSQSEHEWLCHIRACAYGNIGMKQYAQNHALDLQEFYSRKGDMIRRGLYEPLANDAEISFDLMRASVSGESHPAYCQIRWPNGLELNWPVSAGSSALRDILQTMDEL